MAKIPLQKYREIEYPLTPKSTIHLWAQEAYFKNNGPLAGMISRVGGRWYVEIIPDEVVSGIKATIKKLFNAQNDK